MRSGSRCPAFYGEIPPMRWGILNDDGRYFYCITYKHFPALGKESIKTIGQCRQILPCPRRKQNTITITQKHLLPQMIHTKIHFIENIERGLSLHLDFSQDSHNRLDLFLILLTACVDYMEQEICLPDLL